MGFAAKLIQDDEQPTTLVFTKGSAIKIMDATAQAYKQLAETTAFLVKQ